MCINRKQLITKLHIAILKCRKPNDISKHTHWTEVFLFVVVQAVLPILIQFFWNNKKSQDYLKCESNVNNYDPIIWHFKTSANRHMLKISAFIISTFFNVLINIILLPLYNYQRYCYNSQHSFTYKCNN